MEKKNQFVIAVYVDNQSGVLTRVTSMFTRRGFNIDALTVGETESPEYSRITISLSGDGYAREQLINQLRKLHNVVKIEYLEPETSVTRELMLIKVKTSPETRAEIIQIMDIFRERIIDIVRRSMIIEATGDEDKIEAIVKSLQPFGIQEIVKTGVSAMVRSPKEK